MGRRSGGGGGDRHSEGSQSACSTINFPSANLRQGNKAGSALRGSLDFFLKKNSSKLHNERDMIMLKKIAKKQNKPMSSRCILGGGMDDRHPN